MPPTYDGSWVEALNKHGFSVCGVDQVGHGFSAGIGGLRCFFQRFQDLSTDFTALARCARPLLRRIHELNQTIPFCRLNSLVK